MDYKKLDAPLTLRIESVDDRESRVIPVIVRLADAPSDEQLAVLRGAGVSTASAEHRTVSADLSRQDVERLSDEPWVAMLSLAMPRFPMGSAR
ncbi:hypothetical protein [Streptomyces albireticuli]